MLDFHSKVINLFLGVQWVKNNFVLTEEILYIFIGIYKIKIDSKLNF